MLGPLQNPATLAHHQYAGWAFSVRYHILISVPWGLGLFGFSELKRSIVRLCAGSAPLRRQPATEIANSGFNFLLSDFFLDLRLGVQTPRPIIPADRDI